MSMEWVVSGGVGWGSGVVDGSRVVGASGTSMGTTQNIKTQYNTEMTNINTNRQ